MGGWIDECRGGWMNVLERFTVIQYILRKTTRINKNDS